MKARNLCVKSWNLHIKRLYFYMEVGHLSEIVSGFVR